MALKLQPLSSPYTVPKPYDHAKATAVGKLTVLRDNFKLTTWIALGALTQGIASYFLPPRHALLPVTFLLLYRGLRSVLMAQGVLPNSQMDGVVMGKFTAQIPGPDGSPPTAPADQDVAAILLGARSNHALGIFAKGFREVGEHLDAMIVDLHEHGEKYGFLGNTRWIGNERETNNQVMTICYFRTMEGLHNFAHGPIHRKAWDWWNNVTKTFPYLSIMHEVYHAPKGHWENIYANCHLNGLSNTTAVAVLDGEPTRPLYQAGRGSLRTQLGRLGRGDGTEHDKYGFSPYAEQA
ncbi:hypothetical protein VTK26DRAFT_1222 [Humicola hyalothermophila]